MWAFVSWVLLLVPFALFLTIAFFLPHQSPLELLQWLAMFLPYYIGYCALYNISLLPYRARAHLKAMYPKLAAYVETTPLSEDEGLPLVKSFPTKGLAFPTLNVAFRTDDASPLRGIKTMEWHFATRVPGNVKDSVFLSKDIFIPGFEFEGRRLGGSVVERILHFGYVAWQLRRDKPAWGEFSTMLNGDARLKELIRKLRKTGLTPHIEIKDIGDSAHLTLALIFNPLFDAQADGAVICELLNRLAVFTLRYADHVARFGGAPNYMLERYFKMEVPIAITVLFYGAVTALFLLLFTAFQFFIGLPWYAIQAMDGGVVVFMLVYLTFTLRARAQR